MPLSAHDFKIHNDILDRLSDVFLKVSMNLDVLVSGRYRNHSLPWKEIFEKNIDRIAQLKSRLENINKEEESQFYYHGLTGNELDFKYGLIINPHNKFTKHFESVENKKERGKWKNPRRWLFRFLSYMNVYLDSLGRILPLAGVVKEFKDFIENSIQVSQRQI